MAKPVLFALKARTTFVANKLTYVHLKNGPQNVGKDILRWTMYILSLEFIR